ncbi:LysR family transcriptional regulator [Cupriavidus pauculus]|nr:LysR family transcriptional regulator [Cupriavidus pauculus]
MKLDETVSPVPTIMDAATERRMRDRSAIGKMDLRHLRCFMAVAEELHFARAAERLHIEQSPLSRTIKELEDDLGATLFARTTRRTRLSRAGQTLLGHAHRVFAELDRARDAVQAVTHGFRDQLCLALSDGSGRPGLPALLANSRLEDPDVDFRLFETTVSKQVDGLLDRRYDVGFALTDDVGDDIVSHPIWREPLVVALPAHHPLLCYRRIPLEELLTHPLVLWDPEACEGLARSVDGVLRLLNKEPLIQERVASVEMMLTLVGAGAALALTGASQAGAARDFGIELRPVAGAAPPVTTYLLHLAGEPRQSISRLVTRAGAVGPAVLPRRTQT